MLLIKSLAPVQSSDIVSSAARKIEQDGVVSFLTAAADRISYNSSVLLFKTLFGSITRDEMIQRAKQSDQYWKYGSSEKIEVQNQENEDVPDLFEDYSGTYEVSQPFVCELNGGRLINATDPFVLTRDRKVVMEAEKPIFGPRKDATQADTPFHKRTEYSERTAGSRMWQLCRGYALSQSGLQKSTHFERVFPLIEGGDFGYYHWLLEKLPTVRGLKHYEEVTGREPTVVVESNPPEWVQETLSLVGIDNFVTLDVPFITTNRLIISSCRETVPRNQSVYEPSEGDIRWLNHEMKSRAPPSSMDHPDRIYISRENLDVRYVTNRKELEGVLEEFDIEICTPETLSVAEQIRLYENADLIVGPHGGALANTIFSKEASIIEFHTKPYPSYQHLSQLCGHEYQFLQCEGGSDHHTPFEVDVPELRNLLASSVH